MFSPRKFSLRLVFDLTVNDFKTRYLDSLFGSLWAFLLPLFSLSVIFLALRMGLRAEQVAGVPFFFYLACGLLPWTFFAESMLSAMNSIVEKNYLVKKIIFNIDVLPFTRAASHLPILIFFNVLIVIIALIYDINPSLAWIQLLYYDVAVFALVCSFAWLTSSLTVFARDLKNVVGLLLQAGFWITPVIWSPELVPEKYNFIILLNPMAYVIMGLREAMTNGTWFWEHPKETLLFWSIVVVMYEFGRFTFTRLKTHFADVI